MFVVRLRERIGHDLLLLPAVCALVFDERGHLLLGRRSDTGDWALVGGIVDPGEDVGAAVVREVWEETGVRVRADRISGVYTVPDVHYPNGDHAAYVVTTFCCTALEGQPHVNDDESLEVGYFAVDALPPLPESQLVRVRDALSGEAAAAF